MNSMKKLKKQEVYFFLAIISCLLNLTGYLGDDYDDGNPYSTSYSIKYNLLNPKLIFESLDSFFMFLGGVIGFNLFFIVGIFLFYLAYRVEEKQRNMKQDDTHT